MSLILSQIQIRTTVSYHLTPARMGVLMLTVNKGVGKWNTGILMLEILFVLATMENSVKIL